MHWFHLDALWCTICILMRVWHTVFTVMGTSVHALYVMHYFHLNVPVMHCFHFGLNKLNKSESLHYFSCLSHLQIAGLIYEWERTRQNSYFLVWIFSTFWCQFSSRIHSQELILNTVRCCCSILRVLKKTLPWVIWTPSEVLCCNTPGVSKRTLPKF